MTTQASSPSFARRALAIISLLLAAVLVAALIVFLVNNILWLIVAFAGLALAAAGLWWALTEHLPRRAIGLVAVVAGAIVVVAALVQVFAGWERPLLRFAVVAAVLAVAALTARLALAPDLRELDRIRKMEHVHPRKPVLLCNPWSGGGKVEKFGLKGMADELGVETVFLDKGLDLAELARAAIARGADCLGMAGGDGSQALVASIAHEHGIPFVCISAGTRNHFAQDLGFDKEDPRQGMIAFKDGVERFIDFGTVGDRLFVNNVSMGIYATIVQEEGYREAKLQTSREMLPEMLSPQAEPFDLQFTTPDGEAIDDAFVVQVSNNPYVWGASRDIAQRRAMDSGKLGVFAVNTRTGREAAELITRAATGLLTHSRYFHDFTCDTFEVRSRSGKAFAGIDGEALELETPLEFRIHPQALRMLVPEDVMIAAQKRRTRGFSPGRLFAVAAGREPEVPGAGEPADSASARGAPAAGSAETPR